MKKLMILAIAATAAIAACKKQDVQTSTDSTSTDEVVNVNLASNESFKYTLTSDAAAISDEASHASLSRVSITPGSTVFEYVPDSNFTGTDVVTLTFTPSGNCGCHHGPPPHQPDSLHQADSLHHGGCHHGPPPQQPDSVKCGGHHGHGPKHGKKGKCDDNAAGSNSAARRITFKFNVGAAAAASQQ